MLARMLEGRKEIHMRTTRMIAAAVLCVGAGLSLQMAQGQQPGIGRTDVLRHDLGETGREVIQVRVDFAPGAAFGMHTHPGEEVAYVLEGSLEYQFEGKPPVTLKAGDSLFIPAGTPHAARNVGSVNAAELATYLVDKGKPLVVLSQVSAR
jgi:quercetin dioxygenase-like cupin family protein